MKVVHINYSHKKGGAAQAMLRLHTALLRSGVESSLCCLSNESDKMRSVLPQRERGSLFLNGLIQSEYINNSRSSLSDTSFTLPSPGHDLRSISAISDADVINLHWINYFLSPSDVRELYLLGKPIVWTLHDEWPYSGGCHYTSGCSKFRDDCSHCPQLEKQSSCIPVAVLNRKKELWKNLPFSIVGPSKWISERAESSGVFNVSKFHHIPNSIDTKAFAPADSSHFRKELGVSDASFVVLFGADSIGEKRKGFDILLEAIENVLSNEGLRDFDLHMLCFGKMESNHEFSAKFTNLGYLETVEEISKAYQVSDLFVLPSLEDNLPNTMLESMSCGTPVLGFDTGGITDVIIDGVNGFIATEKNATSLSRKILEIADRRKTLSCVGDEARKSILESYTFDIQAASYVNLYKSVIGSCERKHSASHPPPDGIAWVSGLDRNFLKDRDFHRLCYRVLSVPTENRHNVSDEKSVIKTANALLADVLEKSEVAQPHVLNECTVSDLSTVTFLGGFGSFEGPYSEYELPQFVWCYAPRADVSIRSEDRCDAILVCRLQCAKPGIRIRIENNERSFSECALEANFGNRDGLFTEIRVTIRLNVGENYLRFIFTGDFEDGAELALFSRIEIVNM